MQFVKLNYGPTVYYVATEHITHFQDFGGNTKIYFLRGDTIVVEGAAVEVARKLRSRDQNGNLADPCLPPDVHPAAAALPIGLS